MMVEEDAGKQEQLPADELDKQLRIDREIYEADEEDDDYDEGNFSDEYPPATK